MGQMKDNPFGALGVMLGGSFVNNMVDAYVTPYGLGQILTQKFEPFGATPQQTQTTDKERLDRVFKSASYGYDSPSRFSITLHNEDVGNLKLVLTRNGWDWRLTNILLLTTSSGNSASYSLNAASPTPKPELKTPLEARLNVPLNIDGIEILITGIHIGKLEKIQRQYSFGRVPDTQFLLVDVALKNTTEGTIIQLFNIWEHAVVKDNFGNIYEGPYSFALDRSEVRGLVSSQSLKPSETATDMMVFGVPLDNAQKFTLTCDPNFYRAAENQQLNQISDKSFKLEFTRADIKSDAVSPAADSDKIKKWVDDAAKRGEQWGKE
jgi:hypothetical protein